MRGKNKYIVPLLLAGLTTTTGVVTTINQQQQTVITANTETTDITNVEGVSLSLQSGFDDIYPLGSTVKMPKVTFDGPVGSVEKIVYTITRGSKKIEEFEVKNFNGNTTEGDLTFEPSYTGAYKVEISAVVNGRVATKLEGLTIMVEKTDAVINLPVNSNYVIPAKVAVNTKTFKIPVPEVEYINNVEIPGETNRDEKLVVSLVTPSGTYPLVKETPTDKEPYYSILTEDEDDDIENGNYLNKAGTYQIRYEYFEYGKIVTRLESNFQVVEELDVSKMDLAVKLQSSISSTGNVNTDISVPKVKVYDRSVSTTDSINAHISVTYVKINDDGTYGEEKEINYDDYTFHPTEIGEYKLIYKADLNELYGVESTSYNPDTTIKVTDNKEPTIVRATYDYDYTFDTETNTTSIVEAYVNGETVEIDEDTVVSSVLKDRQMDIPSVAIVDSKTNKATIKLPAIYAEDNFSDWKNITFTREIVGNEIAKKSFVSTSNRYEANKTITKEYYTDSDGVEKERDITLGVGNYEIRYIAVDEKGKKSTATYTLEVKNAEDVANAETEVKLTVGVSTITDKEKLTFNVPTAKDTYDSKVEVVTSYQLYDEENNLLDEIPLTETNDDGKYEIDIKAITDPKEGYDTAAYMKIIARANVDAYRVIPENELQAVRTVKIIKVNAQENSAPILALKDVQSGEIDAAAWNNQLFTLNQDIVITKDGDSDISIAKINNSGYAVATGVSGDTSLESIAGGKLAAFDQGKDILKIPAVTFKDADENLKIKLTITDRLGNVVSKYDYESVTKKQLTDKTGNWVYTISGASFKLSASGMYTVTFRAEDVAGGVTVKSYGIRVNNRTAPTIVIEDEDHFGVDVEVGDVFEVPAGNLIVDGEVDDNIVQWRVYGGDFEIVSDGFRVLSEGTYYVEYYGSDDLLNEQTLTNESLYYINAKDTTAPKFNDDSSITIAPTMEWKPEENPNTNVKEMKIEIPVVLATDPIVDNPIDVKCTVTGPDGSTIKIQGSDDEDFDKDYFIATKQGVYTIYYEATDDAKNTISMKKELKLGDCVNPVITWSDEDAIIPSTVGLNEIFTLDIGNNNLKLSDNESSPEYLAKNMTIKLIKPDGTTEVKNLGTPGKSYSWKMTETGEYTLSIVVKDEAGMTESYKKTIVVPEEELEEKTISPVVGTVLVVVSVVILAGVVIYFVVSSRKKATAKTSKNRRKK